MDIFLRAFGLTGKLVKVLMSLYFPSAVYPTLEVCLLQPMNLHWYPVLPVPIAYHLRVHSWCCTVCIIYICMYNDLHPSLSHDTD